MNQKLRQIVSYLGLFFFTSGISYFFFARFLPPKTPPPRQASTQLTPAKSGILIFSGPKTEACPINGQLYTREEKDLWSQTRPLLAMIENHVDARPQSGLTTADLVYEAVAEGGITRFLAVYYCAAQKGSSQKYDIGPVRSTRTYFLDLASEYGDYPLYVHVGGANCSAATPGGACTTHRQAQAVEQIAAYGWNNAGTWGDLSQFALSYRVCRREPERTGTVKDTEHTMYCSTKELWNEAAINPKRGLTNITKMTNQPWNKYFKSWGFKQKDQAASGQSTNFINFVFWTGHQDYAVTWAYNSTTNSYLRFSGGLPHVDFDSQEQLLAKNIVLQFVKESRSIDVHLHNLYQIIGTGKGLLFQNGSKTDISWTKASRTSRTIFRDVNNKEINFVPGPIWVEILPLNTAVTY